MTWCNRLAALRQELEDRLLNRICAIALRLGAARPDHLYHADGTIYMRRYWIIGSPQDPRAESRFFALRLHHIATHDRDVHMHDHPWPFVSLVLRGAYAEARPVSRKPCFEGETESAYTSIRLRGEIAYRRATDRHRITSVTPKGVWTLILLGRIVHWWGFYTPAGKIYWKDYDSFKGERAIAAGTTGRWNV